MTLVRDGSTPVVLRCDLSGSGVATVAGVADEFS